MTSPILIRQGFFFGRNIKVSDRYEAVVLNGADKVLGVSPTDTGLRVVNEWSTHAATKGRAQIDYKSSADKVYSLNLPIKDAPARFVATTPRYRSWANVTHYGAIAGDRYDDTEAFQAAIDSGRPIVYAPYGEYVIDGRLIVRGKVERFDLLFSMIRGTGTILVGPFPGNATGEAVRIENMISAGIYVGAQRKQECVITQLKGRTYHGYK